MKKRCLLSLLLAWIMPVLTSAQDLERRPSLGAKVRSLTLNESRAEGVQGVLVEKTMPNAPAKRAGI